MHLLWRKWNWLLDHNEGAEEQHHMLCPQMEPPREAPARQTEGYLAAITRERGASPWSELG